MLWYLKVSWFQNVVLVSTNLPRNQRHFCKDFCPRLKEVKSKSDDGGSKARHYLDGLLKIPFGVFIKEPIMRSSDKIKSLFTQLVKKCKEIEMFIENLILENI